MSMSARSPESPESVTDILAAVDGKPASYLAAARRLAAADRRGLVPARVSALATFTFDLIVPYLVVEGARRGLAIDASVAPFGQLEQQILDPSSALYASEPTAVVIATQLADLAPELADGFMATPQAAIDAVIDGFVERIASAVRELRARSAAHVIVWNQVPPRRLAAGLADAGLARSQQASIAELNARLARACSAIPGTTVFDAARVVTELGLAHYYDAKLTFLARSPLGGAAQLAVGQRLARQLRALVRPSCKCLVLDLDNTLWGGVLGEDGVGGIALGEDYPGSVFKAFQRALRSYRDRGVLLAIASKNNEADVAELFANHRDMLLRESDFAAREIHWNDKATSLRAIAERLDIGIDSLAFFDDNPLERAWVREQLPEVTVIDVPSDPMRYIDALDGSGAFDQLVVTTDDRNRAEQYVNEHRRRELAATAASPEQFLRALAMKVAIGPIDDRTMPRVVQLLAKTNQFNVTTRRHTAPQLSSMLAGGAIGLWMRVADRFGDHGLVGVAIAAPVDGATWRLDSFLMSCRVLGRRVEQALLHTIGQRARARGARTLLAEFIPTPKNKPAASFFADNAFAAVADREHAWRLDLEGTIAAPDLFEILDEGADQGEPA